MAYELDFEKTPQENFIEIFNQHVPELRCDNFNQFLERFYFECAENGLTPFTNSSSIPTIGNPTAQHIEPRENLVGIQGKIAAGFSGSKVFRLSKFRFTHEYFPEGKQLEGTAEQPNPIILKMNVDHKYLTDYTWNTATYELDAIAKKKKEKATVNSAYYLVPNHYNGQVPLDNTRNNPTWPNMLLNYEEVIKQLEDRTGIYRHFWQFCYVDNLVSGYSQPTKDNKGLIEIDGKTYAVGRIHLNNSPNVQLTSNNLNSLVHMPLLFIKHKKNTISANWFSGYYYCLVEGKR